MSDKPVRLTRTGPGHYTALVRPKGNSTPPFTLHVYCPGSAEHGATPPGGSMTPPWMVESSTERFFDTLRQAREYVNRFFEPAEHPTDDAVLTRQVVADIARGDLRQAMRRVRGKD